ncbi:hypothetical protein DFQ26_003322 [Actinomortierella ambigua]|nr:hypothetical protein DFQ26_003322 [Actinomortierella ambigua]
MMSSSHQQEPSPLYLSQFQPQQHMSPVGSLGNVANLTSQPEQELGLSSRLQSAPASSTAAAAAPAMHSHAAVSAHSPLMFNVDSPTAADSNEAAASSTIDSFGNGGGGGGGGGGLESADFGGEDPAIRRAEQNRAAQRAFRLRKQKYIKWLESKATELDEVYRIMAIVRAENQQLCNMVMELRTQMRRLAGDLNPAHMAPGYLGSSNGNNGNGGDIGIRGGGGSSATTTTTTTTTTMLGQGIEVTRVGDHYESTLGREISMRLMNLGTFKNGGSEGRPRYQPRSSSSSLSSGSSSKRRSTAKSDQSWSIQQQQQKQIEQLQAIQLSPPPPPPQPSGQELDRLSSVFVNGGSIDDGVSVQDHNQGATPMEGVTSPGMTSGATVVAVASAAVMPGPHFGSLQELTYGQPATVPLAAAWNNNASQFQCDESPSPSAFSTPIDHMSRSVASNTPGECL